MHADLPAIGAGCKVPTRIIMAVADREGAESALSAILGRTACYAREAVTRDEMMGSNQSYQGDVDLGIL
jgi:hypothetical protein